MLSVLSWNQTNAPAMKVKTGFLQKNALLFKGLLIGFLVLLLLIPAGMIKGLIYERMHRHNQATQEINQKWSGEQTLAGPILNIPYKEITHYVDSDNKKQIRKTPRLYHVLPEELNINSEVMPEKRKRGIYEVAVYNSNVRLDGTFNLGGTIIEANGEKEIDWDRAFLSVGISDMRGIEEVGALNFNDQSYISEPGTNESQVLASGVHFAVDLTKRKGLTSFSIPLQLKGSQKLYFTPVGKETSVAMNSSWEDPSFNGAFLPDSHDISDDGFVANWNVLHLNRNYPQKWEGDKYSIKSSTFGVDLLITADHYQKSERSVKYAILFLSLTFMVFFFIEAINKKFVHPFQYILIGFALCIFYTLLLSISEHIGFNPAYLISAGMTTGLIAFYARGILKSTHLSLLLEGVLVVMYGFLYVILQLEGYSLLVGSLGLFLIIGLVMYFSRKIDWYTIGMERLKSEELNEAEYAT